ncbi:hypothetical protein ANCCAN_24712 [Ancylostoma caninum]|uniref:Secreted protein n=1 Tax=Ancylostoma caninum TaxID=29170 RepID=A0A368FBJ9_ANCCA|nr:hypothetical protein ANCCAN_24712 [Ancylostoma caninum]
MRCAVRVCLLGTCSLIAIIYFAVQASNSRITETWDENVLSRRSRPTYPRGLRRSCRPQSWRAANEHLVVRFGSHRYRHITCQCVTFNYRYVREHFSHHFLRLSISTGHF